ncbi:MAG: Rho termination factor N-terminal domain-containing protein [Acholeplasmataceae bacterium]|nr:Rho termination factor N-terminal domain-containing protein [Acholeplasmataceae bacterium]
MEKIVFKNQYLNIVIGVILVVVSIVGYILGWVEDFLPLFIGSVLILLSLKRFIYTYKKIVSKNATLILVIELILDIVFAGLLIYLKDHVELFIGLIVYIRGVSYLLINYIATRKIKLTQYILNIGYVTLGAFFMFYPLDSVSFIVITVSILFLIVGAVFMYAGIKPFMKKRIAKEQIKKNEKEQEKIEKKQEKNEEKLEKLEMKVDKVAEVQKKKIEKTESLQKEIEQKKKVIETQKINLDDKTLPELKAIAKERNLEGVSQLNKAQLLIRLKEQLNKK